MFDIRPLGPADLGLVLDMQERISSSLMEKDIFQTSTPEFISYCLADGGRCYGVSYGRETVAYRMVYFPRDREFNLSRDTSLPPSEYRHVGHWDTIAVLPEWRGHGLARLMNARALADLAGTDIRHLFATSSPKNPHGVRSLIEAGFRPVDLVRKFGGKLRFLFYRPSPGGWAAASGGGTEASVPLSSTDELERAFQDGWTGIRVAHDERGVAHLRMKRQPLPFSDGQP
ncbi:GNAT family N-acetyltransferase [Streptomyces sp. NPDC086549]|uniref:GNAT family N-acetyltransferase n=1 Tax=Streptomyces sp. NPDC086549 TaxID=3365752 RepID=UPI0037F8C061